MSAVDHSEGLKANLEEEGALLQDFHIVFTCKVGVLGFCRRPTPRYPHILASSLTCASCPRMPHLFAHSTAPALMAMVKDPSPLPSPPSPLS